MPHDSINIIAYDISDSISILEEVLFLSLRMYHEVPGTIKLSGKVRIQFKTTGMHSRSVEIGS